MVLIQRRGRLQCQNQQQAQKDYHKIFNFDILYLTLWELNLGVLKNMYNNVPPQLWMQLDVRNRSHLVKVFDLKRTGITEIRDNEVLFDGYSVDDLRGITQEKMNAYIGSEESFPRAWELTCAKARYELDPPIEIKPQEDIIIESNEITNNIHGKSKKNK